MALSKDSACVYGFGKVVLSCKSMFSKGLFTMFTMFSPC